VRQMERAKGPLLGSVLELSQAVWYVGGSRRVGVDDGRHGDLRDAGGDGEERRRYRYSMISPIRGLGGYATKRVLGSMPHF
jgi:hypothetical protein